jgi:hypothetical protein
MEWLGNNWKTIVECVGYFYLGATILATLTPTDKDNTLLEKIGSLLDKIGWKLK